MRSLVSTRLGHYFEAPRLAYGHKYSPLSLLQRAAALKANSSSFSTRHLDTKGQHEEEEPSTLEPETLSAYIHLPFCKKKCFYCDFPVIAVGMKPEKHDVEDKMQAYIDLLFQEITATTILNTSKPLETVSFGGGTPSLIPPALLEKLLKKIDTTFGIAPNAEISIEADPGTFDSSQLRSYKSLGINRVSVGVQTFDNELLTTCGRAHDVADVYRAIESIYSADIKNWSLDLMSGLPGLTPEGWQRSLDAALDAAPKHISVYDLQIEENTPFAKQYRPGQKPLPNDDIAAQMYRDASECLRKAGFEHYELSNYALPGYRSRHNMVYWDLLPFYGFGLGAASYLNGRRYSRPKKYNAYKSWVDEFSKMAANQQAKGAPKTLVPGFELPRESPEDLLLDTIMLRLRLKDGLDLLENLKVVVEDGAEAVDLVLQAVKDGDFEQRELVEIERDEKTRQPVLLRLTDPEGLLLSNDIISDIFAALDVTQGEDMD